jgi:hypothetical protein
MKNICLKFSVIILLLNLSGCKDRIESATIAQKITPNISEQINLNYIISGLKKRGFSCNKFDSGIKSPMILCQRIKDKSIDACADSIWIEHDGQNHIISNQKFYECEIDKKLVH